MAYPNLEKTIARYLETTPLTLFRADSFDEAKHPRAADGKFGAGGAKAVPNLTLTQVGSQKGSNPGGIYEHKGRKFYVKFYANHNQAKTEELSSSLFELMGCKTPAPRVAKVNGKDALITRWSPQFKSLNSNDFKNLDPKQRVQVGRMYFAAILTKNWDVVGTGKDNIVLDTETNDMVEVDTGGSFEFRAQGNHKDYGDDIGEHQSLRTGGHDASQVFNHIFENKTVENVAFTHAVKNLDMAKVKKAFEDSGIPNAEKMYFSFKARRDKLLAHYEKP